VEGHKHSVTALLTAAVLLLVLLADEAGAVRRGTDATANTDGDGVNITFTRLEGGSAVGRSAGGGCEWHAVQYNAAGSDGQLPADAIGERPGPDYQLYVIWCGNRTYLRWLGPRDFTDSAVLPLVDELVRRVSVQPAGMNIRPDSRGVTGIPSLFWIEGYGNAPLTASESAFGLTVNVTVALTGVEWNFGDGTPVVTAGLGEAWPERSSVRHTYRMVSGDDPFEVAATLILQPSFDVNGAGGGILAPIRIPVGRDYVVHEVQAMRKK
jgi:hypothetical protein